MQRTQATTTKKTDLAKATDYLIFQLHTSETSFTEFKEIKFNKDEELYFVYLLLKFQDTFHSLSSFDESQRENYEAIAKIVSEKDKKKEKKCAYEFKKPYQNALKKKIKPANDIIKAEKLLEKENQSHQRISAASVVPEPEKKDELIPTPVVSEEQEQVPETPVVREAEKKDESTPVATETEEEKRKKAELKTAQDCAIKSIQNLYNDLRISFGDNKIKLNFNSSNIVLIPNEEELDKLVKNTIDLLESMLKLISAYQNYIIQQKDRSSFLQVLAAFTYYDTVRQESINNHIITDTNDEFFIYFHSIVYKDLTKQSKLPKAAAESSPVAPLSNSVKNVVYSPKPETLPEHKAAAPLAGSEPKEHQVTFDDALHKLQDAVAENIDAYKKIVNQWITDVSKFKATNDAAFVAELAQHMLRVIQDIKGRNNNAKVYLDFFKFIKNDDLKLKYGVSAFKAVTEDMLLTEMLKNITLDDIEAKENDGNTFISKLQKKVRQQEMKWPEVEVKCKALFTHEQFLQEIKLAYEELTDKSKLAALIEIWEKNKERKIENVRFELALNRFYLASSKKKNEPNNDIFSCLKAAGIQTFNAWKEVYEKNKLKISPESLDKMTTLVNAQIKLVQKGEAFRTDSAKNLKAYQEVQNEHASALSDAMKTVKIDNKSWSHLKIARVCTGLALIAAGVALCFVPGGAGLPFVFPAIILGIGCFARPSEENLQLRSLFGKVRTFEEAAARQIENAAVPTKSR